MKLTEVKTDEQLRQLSNLANEIWHEYFPCLLTDGQINYMVEKFQSYEAMHKQMANGYQYFLIMEEEMIGYTGIRMDGKRLFLSKLYLKKEFRGKGYASQVFDFLEEYALLHKLNAIYLTVNKYNNHTIAVYQHKGFVTIDAVVSDIGNGYVMDDYIMEKKLENACKQSKSTL